MTDTQPTQEYLRQGFFGPLAIAEEAYAAIQIGPDVGALVPLEGGPIVVDPETRTTGMFAVWTPPGKSMAAPLGMMEADPGMVGRMVGA
jgi:hypothetical protein